MRGSRQRQAGVAEPPPPPPPTYAAAAARTVRRWLWSGAPPPRRPLRKSWHDRPLRGVRASDSVDLKRRSSAGSAGGPIRRIAVTVTVGRPARHGLDCVTHNFGPQ